jgi:hypothetical protein
VISQEFGYLIAGELLAHRFTRSGKARIMGVYLDPGENWFHGWKTLKIVFYNEFLVGSGNGRTYLGSSD